MRCFIGLGNPGNQYLKTRHNIGFMILDRVASLYEQSFRAGKGHFFFAESVPGQRMCCFANRQHI